MFCGCQDKSGERLDIYICGNGLIEPEEECEINQLGGKSCAYYHGAGATGELRCSSECTIDSSQCAPGAKPTCGNGVLERGEECDRNDFGEKSCKDYIGANASGTLACSDNCIIDLSKCTDASPRCGNGIVEAGEECDSQQLLGKTCTDIMGAGFSGSLSCTEECQLDPSACKIIPTTCGNGQLDAGEVCDGNIMNGVNCAKVRFGYTGVVKCLDDCSGYDTSDCKASDILVHCGDGVLDDDEYCDGDQIRGGKWYTCKAFFGPGSEGTISCKKDCTGLIMDCTTPYTCGNGTQQINERCDPKKDYGDKLTCAHTYGDDVDGNRACNSLCRWNSTECLPPDHCGNGILEPEFGEQCDPGIEHSIEQTCADVFGEGSWGNVTCNKFCHISYTGCFPGASCGNGSLDNGVDGRPNFSEVCDGTNLNKKKCSSLGKGYSGTLGCLNNCSGFDFTNCEYNGSGESEATEDEE